MSDCGALEMSDPLTGRQVFLDAGQYAILSLLACSGRHVAMVVSPETAADYEEKGVTNFLRLLQPQIKDNQARYAVWFVGQTDGIPDELIGDEIFYNMLFGDGWRGNHLQRLAELFDARKNGCYRIFESVEQLRAFSWPPEPEPRLSSVDLFSKIWG